MHIQSIIDSIIIKREQLRREKEKEKWPIYDVFCLDVSLEILDVIYHLKLSDELNLNMNGKIYNYFLFFLIKRNFVRLFFNS